MFCVLVASSDGRKDIFDVCFAHSERIWKDCDWPRYVGLTHAWPDQHGFKVVRSRQVEWRKAVADYVDALPEEIRYILLMVEDTLFMEPVDAARLNKEAWWAANSDVPYLRLVPISRSWPARILDFPSEGHELISPLNPYYSSTEMALWRRSYLRKLLDLPADAWQFEDHVLGPGHWAVDKAVFVQHQIVQKGRWNWAAPRLLRSQGLSIGDNPRVFQTWYAWLRGHWQNLNFALFGFTSVRIKRWLRH